MTTERTEEARTGEDAAEGRTVSVLGAEVVVEEEFVTFPWRAGMARAPAAYVAVFVLTALVAAVGGFGSGSLPQRFALLGLVVFNVHNIPVTTGAVPQLLVPIAEPLISIPGLGGLLRGLFTFGQGHAAPLSHVADIFAGKTGAIGHGNIIANQQSTGGTDVPTILYYLLPPLALVGAGYEFADNHWEAATTDTFAEVARFGVAVAAGYVVVLLVASVLFTLVTGIAGPVTVLADRYLLVVFGFAYPTIFATLGAGVVYLRRTE